VVKRQGAPLPSLLIPVLLGVLVYLGTISGGFLSDDYLIALFVGPDGSILWENALRDFGGPWGGFEGGLYRPLISMSLCVDTMLGSGGPAAFHATNLCFHAVSIFCVAWLCGRLARQRKGVLALLGGSLFAVSPVGVESVAWILGRVSSQEVALRLVALCFFTTWLEDRRPGRYVLTIAFAMAALLSKESAIVLPVAFLGLDLMQGGRGRPLILRQLLFVPIWIAYAALRLHALSTEGARSAGDRLAAWPSSLLPKVEVLFLPGVEAPMLLWALIAFLGLLLFRIGAARLLWVLVALLLWSVQFLPISVIAVDPDLSGSRILYGPLAFSMVVFAAGMGLPARGIPQSLAMAIDSFLLGLLFICMPFLGNAADQRIADYQRAWALVGDFRREVGARTPDSSTERPMALLSAPEDRWGIPLLRADTLFNLLEPPFSDSEVPMLSLIPALRDLPTHKELYLDALPLRKLWSRGSQLLIWDGKTILNQFKAQETPNLDLERVSARKFRFAKGPVTPFALQGLELRVEGTPTSLGIVRPEGTQHEAWQDLLLGPGIKDARGTRHRIDLSHDILPLIAGISGGVVGFELAGEGKLLSIKVLPTFEPFVDGLASLEELHLSADGSLILTAPALPAAAMRLRFYLIGPHGGFSMEVNAGKPIQLAADKVQVLRSVLTLSPLRRFYVWFEALPQPGKWPLHSPGAMVRLRTD
jgi:hypothetical protein